MKRQKIPDTTLWLPQPFLYCGPTAISAITGLDYYGHIRPAINRVRCRKPNAGVTGMRNYELVRTLARLGWLMIPNEHGFLFVKNGVLRLPEALRAIFDQGIVNRSDILVVETTRHYVTVQSNVAVDNHCIDSLIRHPARRQLAKRAWKIVWMKTDMVAVRRAA